MEKKLKLPLTIEKQLERYYTDENHTERHEILWHAWNQNKRWINQLLQMTLSSFPTYSKHDESHASAVLHNIEMILGEDRIAELSASDCFVLLHTVYIHDIGMCITYEDRENIVKNKEFIQMIEDMEEEGDHSLSNAIEALKRTDYSYQNEEEELVKMQKLYEDKLQVYYALIHLISDYSRREHGVRSKERLYKWTLEPDKLGIGFSLSGIPLRIFLSIANSAQLHTNPKFDEVLNLPQEDDGFALDYYHPRFISVLLQLGDILDMDNNRFHPLTKECMGTLPEVSQQHFDKHLAIRTLHIRPDKITIEADCRTQESLRLVRKECDMLTSMLEKAGYYWSVICPPGFNGSLPTLEPVKLYLDGQMIPEELVSAQFKISQKKAFTLLEGGNVYSGRFVFLREFLQNAVDATKMQYWNECCNMRAYYDKLEIWKTANPRELNKKMSVENFPIEIVMEIQKKDKAGKLTAIGKEDIELLDKNSSNDYIYGVNVKIKDFGTGIDKDRILKISEVGSSRKSEKMLIESMPEWLRPTAEFGVGLQSAFIVTSNFKCYTHTRTGQRYEITFGAVSTTRYEGYINVKPVKENSLEAEQDTFGTCFEVFVPCNKKFLHQDYFEAWNGEDPFDKYYESRRPLRHSVELLSQMALYLDNQVGELLFPVNLHIKNMEKKSCSLDNTGKNKIRNLNIFWDEENNKSKIECVEEDDASDQIDENGVKIKSVKKNSNLQKENKKEKISWIYTLDEYDKEKKYQVTENGISGEIDKVIFAFDYSSGGLHIWDGEKSILATMNAKNLIDMENVVSGAKHKEYKEANGTKVYYKGIAMERRSIEEDTELIEYIDIKGGLRREYINLNRNGFTAEGEIYFKEEIYRPIIKSVKKVLKYIEKQWKDENQDFSAYLYKNINEQCKRINKIEENILQLEVNSLSVSKSENDYNKIQKLKINKNEVLKELETQIISIIMLCYLAMREEYDQVGCAMHDKKNCPWKKIIDVIMSVLEQNRSVLEFMREDSNFFNIISFDEDCNYLLGRTDSNKYERNRITFVDIFSPKYSYAIAQVRDNDLRPWKEYLIQLPSEDNVLDRILELKFIRSIEERKKAEKAIEIWGKKILHNAKNFKEHISIQDESKQQFIIKWILKSVPTVGVFANDDGNIRVNVLCNKTMPFLYVNENFKYLVVHRLLETWEKDGIKRFSSFSWHSNMYLGCKNVPYKIFSIERGYFGQFDLNKTVFPIGEKELYQISKVIQEDTESTFVQKFYELYEYAKPERYLRTIHRKSKDDSVQVRREDDFKFFSDLYYDLIFALIREKCEGWEYQQWEDIYLKNDIKMDTLSYNEFCDYCYRLIEKFIYISENDESNKEETVELKNNNLFWEICKIWIYLSYSFSCVSNQESHIHKIKNNYYNDLKNDKDSKEEQQRLYEYVSENSIYDLSIENIENCYVEFANEIFYLFEKMEQKKRKSLFDKIPERTKKFLVEIAEYYQGKLK